MTTMCFGIQSAPRALIQWSATPVAARSWPFFSFIVCVLPRVERAFFWASRLVLPCVDTRSLLGYFSRSVCVSRVCVWNNSPLFMCKDICFKYFNKIMMVLVEMVALEMFRISSSDQALTSQHRTLTGMVHRPF